MRLSACALLDRKEEDMKRTTASCMLSVTCSSGNVFSANLEVTQADSNKGVKVRERTEGQGQKDKEGYLVKRDVLPLPQSPSIMTLNLSLAQEGHK